MIWYSFRPKLGSENNALYNATLFINDALDNIKKATGIFLNLPKAFDTVYHYEIFNLFQTLV